MRLRIRAQPRMRPPAQTLNCPMKQPELAAPASRIAFFLRVMSQKRSPMLDMNRPPLRRYCNDMINSAAALNSFPSKLAIWYSRITFLWGVA